jgi:hypothetical protein
LATETFAILLLFYRLCPKTTTCEKRAAEAQRMLGSAIKRFKLIGEEQPRNWHDSVFGHLVFACRSCQFLILSGMPCMGENPAKNSSKRIDGSSPGRS